MTADLLLGIDLGTTALKAAAFDARTGDAIAAASLRLPVRSASDGTREQDLGDIMAALRKVTASLRKQAGRRWARVRGVGLSSQAGSAIIADRHTGRALTPMQLWSDARPIPLLSAIAAKKPAGYWQKLSYLDNPGSGLARMVWLRERRPRLFNDANIYVGAGEFAYFQLTGVWRQDAGNALQLGCYDARRHRLDATPLSLIDVGEDFVAPMRQGHEQHPLGAAGAELLKLPQGIPVAGPYFDHEAGFLAASGGGRSLQCSLGTAWVGNFAPPAKSSPPPGLNLVVPSPFGPGNLGICQPSTDGLGAMPATVVLSQACLARAGMAGPPSQTAGRRSSHGTHQMMPDRALVVRVMSAGAVTWDWALATFIGGRRPLIQAGRVFERQLLPPGGLIALPWLTHPNLIDPKFAGGGAFLGVGPHTTPADLLRAVAAGMCCEFAHTFDPVTRGGLAKSIVLTGGASAGRYFQQWLAGLFWPLRVRRVDDEFAGCRGTLHAFGTRATACRSTAIAAPGAKIRSQIKGYYEHYVRSCRALAMGTREAHAFGVAARRVLDAYTDR
ncbi:MAG: FGGY family carbohydrate kinase [Phycisphaerae bacterium]|nr:FGGY family carbohydrate kinase [Phycisphaerae bacterium]